MKQSVLNHREKKAINQTIVSHRKIKNRKTKCNKLQKNKKQEIKI